MFKQLGRAIRSIPTVGLVAGMTAIINIVWLTLKPISAAERCEVELKRIEDELRELQQRITKHQ